MMNKPDDGSVLVIASDQEFKSAGRIWGTGGWLEPQKREALDWFTLIRLMGWQAVLGKSDLDELGCELTNNYSWIVIACDPEFIKEDTVNRLESKLFDKPFAVLTRATVPGTPLLRLTGTARKTEKVSGNLFHWCGPGAQQNWKTHSIVDTCKLEVSKENETWITLNGYPVVTARRLGRGIIVSLAFHPSEARDLNGSLTALLRHLLIWGLNRPVAWIDMDGVMILRMDDPGAAQNVHKKNWSYPELGKVAWSAISDELRQHKARISIGYSCGWIDDGDEQRGQLTVGGSTPSRIPGQVYPSPEVQYYDLSGHLPGTFHDFKGEYEGIQQLRAMGLGDVELHGYTHMYPNGATWSQATDRYENTNWYRELGVAAKAATSKLSLDEQPLVQGIKGLHKYFQVHPTTLIPPGDQWTNEVLELALDTDIQFVDSYYLAIRDKDRFCWTTHVCSPYLNEPDESWFTSGLPVVGYFHDREPALYGAEWIGKCLDLWCEAGAKQFIDFRELAAAMTKMFYLYHDSKGLRLFVTSNISIPLVRPLKIMIRMPNGKLPKLLCVVIDGVETMLQVCELNNGLGSITLIQT
jgi:hypothetical protein